MRKTFAHGGLTLAHGAFHVSETLHVCAAGYTQPDLARAHGRALVKRQGIVEAGHGDDQHNKGWRQHLLRGKAKATLEFMLVRIGSNLSKIAMHKPMELLALT